MSHMILNTKELGLNIRDASLSMFTGHFAEKAAPGDWKMTKTITRYESKRQMKVGFTARIHGTSPMKQPRLSDVSHAMVFQPPRC